MRAIVVLFDTLNRRMMPAYGGTEIVAPNFARLAERTATFDQCYAGSMPCMPARRELHTGRYNFLHRSWGPLEPFDDSVPEMLKKAGIYTHLSTDHQHYWEDGGATYHYRFNSFEFFRGHEGDPWKGHVRDPEVPESLNPKHLFARQDWINRQYMTEEHQHPQTQTFDAGLHFMETNVAEDNWMLQIETFDPHEPFYSYAHYRDQYGPTGDVHFDWPSYRKVTDTDDEIEQARKAYFALVSMCDRSLGRVLDFMDDNAMWDDTMLIVCTDHGFMLGEHGWWGKSVLPWYDETIHTPLHIWDPRAGVQDERRKSLVQTIDIGPTLLEFFDQSLTNDMQGHPLDKVVANDTPVRSSALFGIHGGHVSVTDGRYVYMRASVDESNSPLFEYTLMPTHMRGHFTPQELAGAELDPGFTFTKGAPVLKVPAWALGNSAEFGTLLFDLEIDPEQEDPLNDPQLEMHMAEMLVTAMRTSEAPAEQFERLGLPAIGPVSDEHLLIPRQWDRVQQARQLAARRGEFPPHALVNTVPVSELLQDDRRRAIVMAIVPSLERDIVLSMFGNEPLVDVVSMFPGVGREQLDELEAALAAATE